MNTELEKILSNATPDHNILRKRLKIAILLLLLFASVFYLIGLWQISLVFIFSLLIIIPDTIVYLVKLKKGKTLEAKKYFINSWLILGLLQFLIGVALIIFYKIELISILFLVGGLGMVYESLRVKKKIKNLPTRRGLP